MIANRDAMTTGIAVMPHETAARRTLALTVVAAQGWGDAVGGPAVVVAGHGLGAMIAVDMARLEPGSVAALVLSTQSAIVEKPAEEEHNHGHGHGHSHGPGGHHH